MFNGVFKKMQTEFTSPINYFLDMGDDFIYLNDVIDKEISISFKGYSCLSCNSDSKIKGNGYCTKCFFELPQAGFWNTRPELSKAHLGVEDRNLEYEKKMQLSPHVLYLSLTSDLKVGITRASQIPTRWIDQGASQAIIIAHFHNRYNAGITEVGLKKYYKSTTSATKMLQSQNFDIDLIAEKKECLNKINKELIKNVEDNDEIYKLNFPIKNILSNPKKIDLTKENQFRGKLTGIKGQYLIFNDQYYINIRNNQGYLIDLEII